MKVSSCSKAGEVSGPSERAIASVRSTTVLTDLRSHFVIDVTMPSTWRLAILLLGQEDLLRALLEQALADCEMQLDAPDALTALREGLGCP